MLDADGASAARAYLSALRKRGGAPLVALQPVFAGYPLSLLQLLFGKGQSARDAEGCACMVQRDARASRALFLRV